MTLLALQDAELAYGLHPLLDRASLVVQEGERIGLIGRNGTGKSSLLRAIAGALDLDDGEIRRRDGMRIVLVEQEPALPPASTLRESLVLRGALADVHDDRERWHTEARLVEFLHRLGLDEAAAPESASGGERKRAALALAFALEPDLLLLDEPTNHLDLDGIVLVEELVRERGTAIVITHDRAFLDRVATRIVELDRGLLRSYPGNFEAYEARKADELAAEATSTRKFDKFWAQEEAWIRKGVEARRTRNEGRVRRLESLRGERAARRERLGSLRMALDPGERSGRLVAELTDVSKRFGPRPLVRDLSLRVMRGDRLGVMGPNGAGKSTLLKLILGTLAPDSGDGAPRHAPVASRTSTRCAKRSTTSARSSRPSARARNGSRPRADASTCSPISMRSCSRHSARRRRSRPCPAASATGCCWRACSRNRPTCSSWTSRPTTSTSIRSSSSRRRCRPTTARCCW